MRRIISLINVDLANHPALAHVKSPVTIEHTLTTCPKCQADCWIGPNQKFELSLGRSEGLCYRCIFADPDFVTQELIPMIALNSDSGDAPRRITRRPSSP